MKLTPAQLLCFFIPTVAAQNFNVDCYRRPDNYAGLPITTSSLLTNDLETLVHATPQTADQFLVVINSCVRNQ